MDYEKKKTIRCNREFLNYVNKVDVLLKKEGLYLDTSKIIRYCFFQGIEKLKNEGKIKE